jgi:hypothetical protein
MLTEAEVRQQSEAAFGQWADTWDYNATENGKLHSEKPNSTQDLLFAGAGKTLLCVAYAPGLDKHLETIKKYRDNEAWDIACVDKAFGVLCENGIIPEFCFVSDAGISYEKWLKPYEEFSSQSILLTCVTANHEYVSKWRGDRYFYVNKDNIQTEQRYMQKSGVREVIPASSNVGNSVVTFSTQILGYDRYLLVGYDYCWGEDEKYYAQIDSDKRYWMAHAFIIDNQDRFCKTSQNLMFSAKWLNDYYIAMKQIGVTLVNCSGQGFTSVPMTNLEKELKSAVVRKLTQPEKDDIIRKKTRQVIVDQSNKEKLHEYLSTMQLSNVIINYIPNGVLEWVNQL